MAKRDLKLRTREPVEAARPEPPPWLKAASSGSKTAEADVAAVADLGIGVSSRRGPDLHPHPAPVWGAHGPIHMDAASAIDPEE